MRKPSRHMPPLPDASLTTEGCLIWLALAVVAVAALVYAYPPAVVPILALVAWVGLGTNQRKNLRARLADERRGESICTFVRSFPRRSVDAWVLRAVYEALDRAVGSSFAPRSTDPLDFLLGFAEDEDVEDLIVEVADRVGRSLDDPERNPHYGRIATVGDVVRFLSAQPPTPAGLALRPDLGASR